MDKVRGTNIPIVDMEDDQLESFSPENSPGMRARLAAIAAHPRGRALDEFGREVPDPTPMAPPLGYNPSPSLMDQVAAMVRAEHMRLNGYADDVDSFEEAQDLGEDEEDVDEFDTGRNYEEAFEPLAPGELTRRRQAEYVAQRQSETAPDPRRQVEPEKAPEPVERPTQDPGPAGPSLPPK